MRLHKMTLLAGFAAFALVGAVACGDDDDGDGGETPGATTAPSTAAATATSAAAPRTALAILTEAINEEYKARATYVAAIARFGDNTPFANIAQSEDAHVEAWKREFDRLGLAIPADTFAGNVAPAATAKDACAAGVAAEKADVALYERLMKETTDAQLLAVMEQQRKVSLEQHLVAFERCD